MRFQNGEPIVPFLFLVVLPFLLSRALEDEERNTSCPHLCFHLEVVSNLSKGVTSVSLRDLTVNSHLSSDLFLRSLGVDWSSLLSYSPSSSCLSRARKGKEELPAVKEKGSQVIVKGKEKRKR